METPIKIVRLDGVHAPSPTFSVPHTYLEFPLTPFDPTTIVERIGDADVVITTRVPITESTLQACPNLKLVAALAIGTDMIDLDACKARGVTVSNVPAASSEAVAEHAIALYFAVRRNVVQMHEMTVQGEEWPTKGSLMSYWGALPSTCRQEVMGILGGGELGNRVANIGRALGMTVQFADRKGSSTPRPDRVPFTSVLKTSTILILTLPLTPSTTSLITSTEFSLMRSDAILINVARGGIVVEEDLVEALKEGKIKGAATDVFVTEPAGRENALVNAAREGDLGGRLVLSPHAAWFAKSSIEKLRRVVTENIEGWARGEPVNIVLPA